LKLTVSTASAAFTLCALLTGCGPELTESGVPDAPSEVTPEQDSTLGTQEQALNPGCRDMAIGWPAFSRDSYGNVVNGWAGNIIQSAEDRVFFSYSNYGTVGPNTVRLVLGANSNITWWKGLEAIRPDGGVYPQSLQTYESNRGYYSMDIDVSDRPNQWALKFLKAKMFGIHTGMYCIESLAAWRGRTLYFTWTYDAS
jgi:hypothetical protein